MATIHEDIDAYERWLRRQCQVVEDDLHVKHERMCRSPFHFLRATYFRWARTIATVCPEVADEAALMPYTLDLVRLATSARLAPTLRISLKEAQAALLEGYRTSLEQPRPLLLDEHGAWMRPLVAGRRDAVRKFWKDIDSCPPAAPPAAVRKALERQLPKDARELAFARRTAGGGSLGRPRFIATAAWQGGVIVREAKAIVPSAWYWAHQRRSAPIHFLELAFGAFRSPDPTLAIRAGFALRRLAPDAHKVELADVARQGIGERLLAAMGADLAAVHAGYKRRRRHILDDLKSRGPHWLGEAVDRAEHAVRRDFDLLAPG